MKRSRPTDDTYEITNKKAKNSVVDDTFGLDQYGLDCTVRVWIPEGQRAKRSKRSYICIEGTVNNEKVRFKSLDKFTRALRVIGFATVFDVTEYINRERKRICGHETNRNQYAQTPDSFYEYMRSTMDLQVAELDPCPPNPTFDGLHTDFRWTAGADETVYVNPPFRQAGEWIQKAYQELDRGSCTNILFMLPSRMAAPWFGLLCGIEGRAYNILIPNRVTFKGYTDGYPWGVMLVQVGREISPVCRIQHIDESFK